MTKYESCLETNYTNMRIRTGLQLFIVFFLCCATVIVPDVVYIYNPSGIFKSVYNGEEEHYGLQ